jgi:SdpC family antimicrobial peptide
MKIVRKIVKNKLVAITLSGILLFTTSCTKESLTPNGVSNSTTSSNSKFDDYTGEELFEGVFFAQGKVAEEIPSIRNSASYFQVREISSNLEKNSTGVGLEEIMNKVNENNPNYYSELEASVSSGDHLLISEKLQEGAEHMHSAVVELYLTNSDETELNEILASIDLDKHKNVDGSVNYISLEAELMEQVGFNGDENVNEKAITLVAGIVLVAAAYVLVVHAAGVMTYVGFAWVAYNYAAVGGTKPVNVLSHEMLVRDLAN